MSKNSHDEPDEYEAIFDDSYNNRTAKDPREYQEQGSDSVAPPYDDYIIPENEVNDIDASNPDSGSLSDSDIEDGIFAPQRSERVSSKKSSSLMWAVSLLALVGVGGYVYISNPDMIKNVTANFNGQDLDSQNLEIVSVPSGLSVDTNPVPENAPIIPSDGMDSPPPSVVDTPAVNEVVLPSSEATQSTPDVLQTVVPAESEAQIQPTQPEIPNSEEVSVPSIETMKTESVVADQPPESSQETLQPADVSVATPAPSIEEAAKKTDLSSVEKKVENDGHTPNADSKTEMVAISEEEQKRLDDANLDKYFDSPNGKILKDIPAPSLDPKKGSNESIIIVNKGRAGKTSSKDNSIEPNSIKIETTSLGTQTIAASRALKLGRLEAAKEMYDELYRLNPKDGRILSGRALVLQKMGYADQAIAAYDELLNIYPDNTDAIVNLAGLIRKQYPAVALNKLLDLHMKHPDNVFVTAQLGVAHADAGNYPDALRYLDMAVTMDPHNPLHYFNRAVIFEKAGKPEQAIRNYEQSLEVDAVYGQGQRTISKEKIYDRLSQIRGN